MKKILCLFSTILIYLKNVLPNILADIIFGLASVSIFYGLYCIYRPLAFILCGVAVIWLLLDTRTGKK